MSKPFTPFPNDPEDEEETPVITVISAESLARLHAVNANLLAACRAALADTLKPIHLQEPDVVIPMLKAAIQEAGAITNDA